MKGKAAVRAKDLEIERLKIKLSSLQEQNDFLKNRVKQCNNNLDTLIGQLKYKEKSFEEQKKLYEAEINLLKKSLNGEKERYSQLKTKFEDLCESNNDMSNQESFLRDNLLNETTESKRIEKDVKNLLNNAGRGDPNLQGQHFIQESLDKARIKELEEQNEELLEENKQLKEVAMMIDNMINFAQNNDILLKRKKDLQKKKNMLRIEIQKQMASLGELKNKVGPIDGNDLYGQNSAASPRHAGYTSERKAFDVEGKLGQTQGGFDGSTNQV